MTNLTGFSINNYHLSSPTYQLNQERHFKTTSYRQTKGVPIMV